MTELKTMLALGAALLVVACVDTGAPERTEAPTDTAGAGVPIRLAGPGGAALLVPVRINGEGPWDFVLDTGATFTCLDETLADSLALPESRGQVGVGQGIRGGPTSMRLVEINRVTVGEASAEALTGCALDLSQFESMGLDARGLLGLNFLSSFHMTLDFESERLLLTRP